jgi:endonuclease/exonuclease/phosphatase family metal-dependent hydrolase
MMPRALVSALCALVLVTGSAFAQTLPTSWASLDIGSVGPAGSASGASGSFTLTGAGADIWGTADAFRFAYTRLTGDGSIVTRVSSVENVHAWTKAGVMMRETLNANSRHAFMLVSAGKGLAFQRRTATGGSSVHTSGGSGTAPAYVKLTRSGSQFRAYMSVSGSSWTLVGSQAITMASTIYVGVAVGSHASGVLAHAAFDQTAVTVAAIVPTDSTASTTSTGTAVAGTLRLLHWNSHHGGRRTDGVYDPAGFAGWMARLNPDIVTLNEVDDTTQANTLLSYLKAKMPGVPWTFYLTRGNMILSRLPIASKSYCLVNAGVNRQATHVSITVNGRPLNVWDAHLALDSSSVRLGETKAIQACEINWAEARIVAGDFNMQAGTAEYTSMLAAHADAWVAAKALGTAKNYSGNCDGCTRNSRIDYVFTSKGAASLVLKSVEIVDTRNASGVMPSDHKPMLAVYTIK